MRSLREGQNVGMIRLRTLLVGAVVAGALASSACGDDGAGSTADVSSADLDGRVFVATEFTGHEIVDGSEIMISFEGERLSIRAGCNTQNGEYTLSDGTISAPMLMSTMMACQPELMDQDAAVATLFAGTPAVALDGDTLTIDGGSDGTLTLESTTATRS